MARNIDVFNSDGRPMGDLRGTGQDLEFYDSDGRYKGRAEIRGSDVDLYDDRGRRVGSGHIRDAGPSEMQLAGSLLILAVVLAALIFYPFWRAVYTRIPGEPGVAKGITAAIVLYYAISSLGIGALVYFKFALPRVTGMGLARAWNAFLVSGSAIVTLPAYAIFPAVREPVVLTRIGYFTFAALSVLSLALAAAA